MSHQKSTIDSIHQLFDAVDVISVQGYDEERRVIYWNVGSELLYGYCEQEALGNKLEELIIPEPMRPFIVAAHSDWLNKDIEIPAGEVTLCNKSGNEVHVFSSHVMFVNQDNKKQMYCLDISLAETRHAQAQVIFKENMLKAIFEGTPDIFFLMQEDGTITDYHASNKKQLYVSPKDFIGKPVASLLPAKVAGKLKTHITKAIEKGGISSFEYELNVPHGLIYFEARIIYLKSDRQIAVIVRDITEQHKSNEVIRKQAYFDA